MNGVNQTSWISPLLLQKHTILMPLSGACSHQFSNDQLQYNIFIILSSSYFLSHHMIFFGNLTWPSPWYSQIDHIYQTKSIERRKNDDVFLGFRDLVFIEPGIWANLVREMGKMTLKTGVAKMGGSKRRVNRPIHVRDQSFWLSKR